jgi:hypothetical protein
MAFYFPFSTCSEAISAPWYFLFEKPLLEKLSESILMAL